MSGHPVEILAIENGESLGVPMALVTLRAQSGEAFALLFSQEQCVRLRDTFDAFLNDPQSWLFMPKEEQVACVVEEVR